MPTATVRRYVLALGTAVSLLATATGLAHAQRAGTRVHKAPVPYNPRLASGLSVTPAGPLDLINCIAGPDIFISNVAYHGAPAAAGLFTGGTSILGFEEGIVLSSGDAMNVVGPNTLDDISASNGTPGDPDLDQLIPGFTTQDAASIEFDFDCAQSTIFSLIYVFASEEYNEYVDSEFNDVFAFYLDGHAVGDNIAIVPGSCGTTPGIPVSINNVNCGNPFGGAGVNCACFRNNALPDGGGTLDTEMDGLTGVFSRAITITPGAHHMKIAIADAGDDVLDSNVFIACQSLRCSPPVPTKKTSWGGIKGYYR